MLTAGAWSGGVRAALHNMVVDTYAMQHPEEFGRSPKSYIRHLSALGCLIEHPGDEALYWARTRRGPPAVPPKPSLLAARGEVTIADVAGEMTDADFGAAVHRWAESVWAACAPQHDLARRYLAAVRACL